MITKAHRARPKPKAKDSFKSVARALGCDESEVAFDKALVKIGRASVPRKPVRRQKRGAKLALPDA
jgi:hypothetical protein